MRPTSRAFRHLVIVEPVTPHPYPIALADSFRIARAFFIDKNAVSATVNHYRPRLPSCNREIKRRTVRRNDMKCLPFVYLAKGCGNTNRGKGRLTTVAA